MKLKSQISFKDFHKKAFFSTLLILFCSFLISACGGKKPVTKAQMSVPIRIHERLSVNVLSYKLITSPTELPQVPVLSGNRKYLAIRVILSNPGKNKGVKPIKFIPIVDKVELGHAKLKDKTIEVNIDHMMADLQKFNFDELGIAQALIGPGESVIGWYVVVIPKDLNPPYTLTINTNDSQGPTRPISVELK